MSRIISVSEIQSTAKGFSGTPDSNSKRLFGREIEIEKLEAVFKQCEQGATKFVFITGEAGIGKSSLLKHFLQGKQKENCFVFTNVGDGLKHYANSVLRSALKNGIESNQIVSDVVSLLATIDRDLLIGFEQLTKTSTDEKDFFRSIEHLFKAITTIGPAVLALDDVQTDDALVLSVLQFLARECHGSPLMVVAVVRKDTEISPILNWFIQTMTQSGSFEEINLKPLSLDQCRSMVSETFGGRGVSESFLDWIYKETFGNPLSIEELAHLIVEEGLIVLTDSGIDIRKTDRTLIPDSLREPILRRIKNLSEVHQYILGLSAVVGPDFDANFVSSMLRECSQYREEMIDELIQMQFFRKSEKGRLHFFNERMRDLIYEEMGKSNRRMFHERIAEELEKLNQADPNKWPELAHHFARMGNLAKTMQYLTQNESTIYVTSEIKTN
jgi:predicted ATPase